MRDMFALIRDICRGLADDAALALSAAVAFYTALSFGPIVLLAVMVTGALGDRSAGELVHFFAREVGPQAAEVAEKVIETSQQREPVDPWRWAAGVAMLLVTASAVFAQLQSALNRIWDVVALPGAGFWGWLRRRLLSLGMVIAICFLLLVSLVITAVIERVVPGDEELAARFAVGAISFVGTTGLFAALFKLVPDVNLSWRDVWIGSLVTAVLFTAGKQVLAIYLTHSSVGAEYGRSAGGLIALLVWVYYSAMIVFVGAEITQHLARRKGRRIEPRSNAITREERDRRRAAARA